MKTRTAELIVHEGDDFSICSEDTHIYTIYWDEESEEFSIRGDISELSKRTAYKIGYALCNYSIYAQQDSVPWPEEQPKVTPKLVVRSGFVYVLNCNGAYKIGHAQKVDKRVAQIEPVMPYPVDVVLTLFTEDRFELEAELHKHFQEKRLGGEWFRLSGDDIALIAGWKA